MPELLVVTLADDDGHWLREYGVPHALRVLTVHERSVEADIHAALDQRGATEAAVTIDQRFMGFLAKRAIDTLLERGVALPTLVHPHATVSPAATLGVGVRVAAGAVVSAGCTLADHARVLERAVLARACRLGSFSTLDPGVLLGEGCQVGAHCWLRAGSVLEPRCQVEGGCELGPAATLRGFVPEGTLQVPGLDGPARIHRFG